MSYIRIRSVLKLCQVIDYVGGVCALKAAVDCIGSVGDLDVWVVGSAVGDLHRRRQGWENHVTRPVTGTAVVESLCELLAVVNAVVGLGKLHTAESFIKIFEQFSMFVGWGGMARFRGEGPPLP